MKTKTDVLTIMAQLQQTSNNLNCRQMMETASFSYTDYLNQDKTFLINPVSGPWMEAQSLFVGSVSKLIVKVIERSHFGLAGDTELNPLTGEEKQRYLRFGQAAGC